MRPSASMRAGRLSHTRRALPVCVRGKVPKSITSTLVEMPMMVLMRCCSSLVSVAMSAADKLALASGWSSQRTSTLSRWPSRLSTIW
jgi:hypothetical protein